MTDPEQLARISFFHERIYPEIPWLEIPAVAIFVYLVTAYIVYFTTSRCWSLILIGLWVLGPPIWFYLEYFWWMPDRDPSKLPDIEAFKYSQELARNFWLAAVATLVAIHNRSAPAAGGEP